MSRNKRWFLWQVGVPIFGPIIVSIVIILFWMSGNPNFAPRIDIILDVSP